MKLFHWLKSLKAPPPEEIAKNPSGAGSEKIYRPLPNNPRRLSTTKKSQTEDEGSAPQPLTEQRRYRRYSTEGRDIRAKMVLSEEIDIANLSIGGACIVVKRRVTPGDNILLNLAGADIDRPLQCRVVWESKELGNASGTIPRSCRAGVRFQAVPPYTLIRLKDFMREFGVPDMKKLSDQYLPSSLRFKIYRNQKASIQYFSPCSVKKISLGGMLIETDQAYAVERKCPVALYLSEKHAPIKCTGRIASQLPVRNERAASFDTGIEFLNMADHDRSHLRNFLSAL